MEQQLRAPQWIAGQQKSGHPPEGGQQCRPAWPQDAVVYELGTKTRGYGAEGCVPPRRSTDGQREQAVQCPAGGLSPCLFL